jgi:ABC-type uncharacterized transport system auxiliary subunit
MRLPVFCLIFALAGCQAVPPVPSDKYYRLEAAQGVAASQTILSEPLYIAPLRAEGPYAERAMLYAPANQSRELQQYHYQLWSEPPAVLLQEHMRASLQAMAFAPRVTDMEMGSGAGYMLNAKVLRLEKITEVGSARAMVALHITLQRKKPFELLLERNYSAEEMVTDNSQHSYVLASESGLKKIYGRFAEDVKALR